jgi:hypothetical protein
VNKVQLDLFSIAVTILIFVGITVMTVAGVLIFLTLNTPVT